MKKRKHAIPSATPPPPSPPAISVPRDRRLPAPQTYEHWTAEEERLLGTRPDRELAQVLGRTVRAIESQRHRLGIYRQPSIRLKTRRWKPAEIALLGTRPDPELATRLGRSEGSVRVQRRKKGIPAFDQRRSANARKSHPLNPWTPREKALLGTMWDRKLAARIGRSEISVRMQRLKMGIPAFGQWHSRPHAEPTPRHRRKTTRS
ncbi:MAG: hypothetical protein HY735_28280 [Verrucomicrobia bacterium]|nr:hypothetical protein [Verrucomicrobiota bacterium]